MRNKTKLKSLEDGIFTDRCKILTIGRNPRLQTKHKKFLCYCNKLFFSKGCVIYKWYFGVDGFWRGPLGQGFFWFVKGGISWFIYTPFGYARVLRMGIINLFFSGNLFPFPLYKTAPYTFLRRINKWPNKRRKGCVKLQLQLYFTIKKKVYICETKVFWSSKMNIICVYAREKKLL